jgi:hypothetical protein
MLEGFMNPHRSRRFVAAAVLLTALGACSAGPPSISDLKVGKDKEVTQPATTFDAKETLYAVAKIDNPPENGKVVGRLAVVDVAGQPAGPIAGLELTLNLTPGMNTTMFDFSAPTAGWPDGKYKIDVTLLDGTGAEKGQKSVELTTTGRQPAAAPAEAATEAQAEGDEPAEPAADSTAPQE